MAGSQPRRLGQAVRRHPSPPALYGRERRGHPRRGRDRGADAAALHAAVSSASGGQRRACQQDGQAVLLRLPSGGGWRLRADGAQMSLEESIYLGGPEPRRSEQVVLTGYADGPQQVKWAISKGAADTALEDHRDHQRRFLAAAVPAAADARRAGPRPPGDRRLRRRTACSGPCGTRVSAWWRCPSNGACRRWRICARLRALVALFRAERPDIVHAHMPISGLLARARGEDRRCAAHRLYVPWFPVQPARAGAAAASVLAAGAGCRADHRSLLHGLRRRGRRCAPARHRSGPGGGSQRPRSGAVPPRPGDARSACARSSGCRRTCCVVIAVSRLVRSKGYPELADALRDLPRTELWVVGERLGSDRGPDMEAVLRRLRPRQPAAAARLSR